MKNKFKASRFFPADKISRRTNKTQKAYNEKKSVQPNVANIYSMKGG